MEKHLGKTLVAVLLLFGSQQASASGMAHEELTGLAANAGIPALDMEALANGTPIPYPELTPAEPQHLTSKQMAARYKNLLAEGKISRAEYDWLMGVNKLDDMKRGQEDTLDINNRAHKTVWTTLLITEQLSAVFPIAGGVKVADFPIWREGSQDIAAAQLAERMDSIFVEIRGAKRNSPESLEYLAKILVIARDGMDVVWLADMIDHLYTFWGE